jgi:hypothetical protein
MRCFQPIILACFLACLTGVVYGDPTITAFFSPVGGAADAVQERIDSAQSKIDVFAYAISNLRISDALKRAVARGVTVRMVVSRGQESPQYTTAGQLSDAGVQTKTDRKEALMHTKAILLDDLTVICGSYNWTRAAEQSNAECLLIIDDANLTALFEQDFTKHWEHSAAFHLKETNEKSQNQINPAPIFRSCDNGSCNWPPALRRGFRQYQRRIDIQPMERTGLCPADGYSAKPAVGKTDWCTVDDAVLVSPLGEHRNCHPRHVGRTRCEQADFVVQFLHRRKPRALAILSAAYRSLSSCRGLFGPHRKHSDTYGRPRFRDAGPDPERSDVHFRLCNFPRHGKHQLAELEQLRCCDRCGRRERGFLRRLAVGCWHVALSHGRH